jgi:hypothetical protein
LLLLTGLRFAVWFSRSYLLERGVQPCTGAKYPGTDLVDPDASRAFSAAPQHGMMSSAPRLLMYKAAAFSSHLALSQPSTVTIASSTSRPALDLSARVAPNL